MKKRGILLFVVFLFILMKSYAIYEESAYSGTVKHGEVIEVSNRNFQFRIDSVSSKVVVDIDSSGVIIENGECRIKDNFDICVKNISFSHRNLTTYLDIYQAEVEIYQIKSSVNVAHTIDKKSILIDEEATAELSVENTADIVAKDFTATIPIPNSILVMETEGCKKSLGSITFKEDIHPKQIKKCIYKIKGLYGDKFELKANASYFDGVETVSTEPSVDAKVYNYSLKISSKLNKSRFSVNEKLNLTIHIKNINDQYDLKITTFNIKVPNNILIIKIPKDAVKNNQVLSWSGSLSPNEEKSFAAELQAQRTGNYSVAAEASYKISKFFRNVEHKAPLGVECDCPYISRELSPETYIPGQKILLRAFLINPGAGSFSNPKINYATNIPGLRDSSTTYTEIKPKESIKIFESLFDAPELHETYHFNITAFYESKNNEVFAAREKMIIKVSEQETGVSEDEEQIKEEEVLEEEILEESIPEGEEGTKEAGQQETEEEISVITLEREKESTLKTYIMIAIIAAIMFVVVVFVVFKRKAGRKEAHRPIKKIETAMPKKRRSIKEMLRLDLLKKENAEIKSKPESKWKKDESYRELERQINKLGISSEGQEKKKLFNFFRKK